MPSIKTPKRSHAVSAWRYKWRFYIINETNMRTLEKESKEWYDHWRACLNASKEEKLNLPILVGDGLRYKRMIVRRRVYFTSMDEVDEKASRSAAERMLTLMYAEKLREGVDKMSKENCPGCEVDHPSQLKHDCIMLDFDHHLYLYFDRVYEALDDDYILSKWEVHLETSELMTKIHPIYLMKYRCLSWLNTDFKTSEWKKHVAIICAEMGKFERCFES